MSYSHIINFTKKIGIKTGLIFFFAISIVHSEPTPVGPINFGGGLNIATIPTEIGDNESPDLCNCLNSLEGGAFKRNGSQRFISQAISSHPVTSLYRAYYSTGAGVIKSLVMTNKDRIYISSNDVNPFWVSVTSGLTPSHWNWVTMNNRAIGAGGLFNNVKVVDIQGSTVTNLFSVDADTNGILLRGKYPLVSKNYFLLSNVALITSNDALTQSATFYNSRTYFSLLARPSSMTALRFFDYRTEDGEELTGIGQLFDAVHIFKPSSIGEVTFTVLDLPSKGGDRQLNEIVNGFGLAAPRTLANTGQFYVMGSWDGIRLWDGGRRGRLTLAEESRIISGKIQPLIDRLIRAGTYTKSVGKYYQKEEWYILSYEDPNKFPRGRLNSVIVYDFKSDSWFPFCNWLAESFEVMNGAGDRGELLYGDSSDGYVHYADVETRTDDSRKEIVMDVMDSNLTWKGSTNNIYNVIEGTGSLKISVDASAKISSMTKIGVFQVGEWYDKTKITKENASISFKVYPHNVSSITSIRVDLELNDVDHDFDNFFTSVTISSAALSMGNTTWNTVEIGLSSFPISNSLVDISSEILPFANTLTFYGIRIVLTGVDISSISVDDLRAVQNTSNPNRMYRFTKLYSFGTMGFKGFGQVLLTREKSPDSNFLMDIYNDFGQKVRTEEFQAEIPKELFVMGYEGGNNIAKLSSVDFSYKESTVAPAELWQGFNGVASKDNLFFYDRINNREIKVNRNAMGVFVTTYGAFGTGTTNFNLVHQQAIDEAGNLYMTDLYNHRIKAHSQDRLSFIKMAGSLGTGASSYHMPTGIKCNENKCYVADESNYRIVMLDKSTFGFIMDERINYNTEGDTSLELDPNSLYVAYNKVSDVSTMFRDVILEQRDVGNLSLINRVQVFPKNSTAVSTYSLTGDIAIIGKYILIPFKDAEEGGSHYIQKRLKDGFDLVDEFKTSKTHFSVIADGLGYKPQLKTEKKDLKARGRYFQLKYYDDALDNNWKLYNQTFLIEPEKLTY